MKRFITFAILTLCLTIPLTAQKLITGSEGKPVGLVDTRGLDYYIEIAETLQKGQQPTEKQWNSLFETTYFFLAIKQFKFLDPEKFKGDMKLVFQTGGTLDEEQKKKLKRHLDYQENLAKLKQYSAKLKEGKVRGEISKHLFPFLPERLRKEASIPPLVYSFYHGEEANGFEDLLMFDALLAYKMDNFKSGILAAHESFHSISNQALSSRLIELPPTDERTIILNVLRGYAGEGIADLIDKEIFYQPDSPVYELLKNVLFKDEEVNFRKYIQDFDKELSALSNGQKITDVRQFHPKVIGFAGHQPGRGMAKVIREAGLLDEVINDVENPFPFIYAYNKAVNKLKKDLPVFSEKSIGYLKKIESEVIKPLK